MNYFVYKQEKGFQICIGDLNITQDVMFIKQDNVVVPGFWKIFDYKNNAFKTNIHII